MVYTMTVNGKNFWLSRDGHDGDNFLRQLYDDKYVPYSNIGDPSKRSHMVTLNTKLAFVVMDIICALHNRGSDNADQNPSAPKRYKTLEDLMLALKLYTENKITTAYVQMQLEKVARTTLKLKNEKDEDDVYTALGEKHVPDTFMRVVKHIVENVDAGATDFDLDSAVLMRMFDLRMNWVSYQHKDKGDKKKTLIVTCTNVTQFSVDVLKAISPIDGCDLRGVYEAFYQATTDVNRIANRKRKIAYTQEKP